jgi:hypothetical protein
MVMTCKVFTDPFIDKGTIDSDKQSLGANGTCFIQESTLWFITLNDGFSLLNKF